jgi:hypothetical protein
MKKMISKEIATNCNRERTSLSYPCTRTEIKWVGGVEFLAIFGCGIGKAINCWRQGNDHSVVIVYFQ